MLRKAFYFVVLVSASFAAVVGQDKGPQADARAILWESVDISQQDVFWGAGGREMFPDLKGATFVSRQIGGNNPKYRIKDRAGTEWIVKIADESQPEVAATRLLWALGYKTEIDYIIPKFSMAKIGPNRYKNVRIESRTDKLKRLDRWSWTANPFVNTREFNGLKILMAMVNNWDLKDENTVILSTGTQRHYVVSDLGSSFGRLAKQSASRSGRSVNKPEHYAESNFVKGVRDGQLELDYVGKADHLVKAIPVEHARWLADLLLQLSDKQIADAFRAANYSAEDVRLLTTAFKTRIAQLDEATRAPTAATP